MNNWQIFFTKTLAEPKFNYFKEQIMSKYELQ